MAAETVSLNGLRRADETPGGGKVRRTFPPLPGKDVCWHVAEGANFFAKLGGTAEVFRLLSQGNHRNGSLWEEGLFCLPSLRRTADQKGASAMTFEKIPYKIYLTEDEMPKNWYNVRADMKTKPAPC